MDTTKYFDATCGAHRRIAAVTARDGEHETVFGLDKPRELTRLPDDFADWKRYEAHATTDGIVVETMSRDGD